MRDFHEKTKDAARGKWKGILMTLGVSASALSGKHGPCPMCGGSDRFRFDNKDSAGTYYCNQCGAGDGIKLAIGILGSDYRDACARIDAIIGNVKLDAPGRDTSMSAEDRQALLRRVYMETRPIEPGDAAHRYLASRGVEELVYPKSLRFHPAMKDGEGGVRPCMVALVTVPGQAKAVTMHRTFLKPDGSGKAEMASPRKLMPGELPDGACVALSDYHGGPLGIAEGIETAMSASALYEMPVWAAINSNILAKWTPPEGCEEVAIFGDNDPKFGGQMAAYSLAHRLAVKGVHVTVHLPSTPGTDWNDIHTRKASK